MFKKQHAFNRTLWILLSLFILTALLYTTTTVDAAVKSPRAIEVFYERDLVLLMGYPQSTEVLVEVIRGNQVIGSARQTTNEFGELEVNHIGIDDCWDPPLLDVVPGDMVQTTVLANGARTDDTDSTVTRDIYIDMAAIAYADIPNNPNATITVKGHALSLSNAPINLATEILEFRLNKVNRDDPWDSNGRRDLRADINSAVGTDGTFTYTFTVSDADATDAYLNGVDQILEWGLPPANEEAELSPEITVFDENEGPPECAAGQEPQEPQEPQAPASPSVPNMIDSSDTGVSRTDDITRVRRPTFAGSAEPGSTVTVLVDGVAKGSGVAVDGAYAIQVSALADKVGYQVTATATNANGTSAPSGALSITIDTVRPTAVVSPANDATGVSRTVNVTAKFSEAVAGVRTGTSSRNFLLYQGETRIPANVTYNSTQWLATLDPSPTLAASTGHTATLSRGIRDIAGNPFQTMSWTFTTSP